MCRSAIGSVANDDCMWSKCSVIGIVAMASERPTRIDLYTTDKVRDAGRRTRRRPNRTLHFIGAVIALGLAACLYLVGFREAVPLIGFLDVLVYGFFAGSFFARSLKHGDR